MMTSLLAVWVTLTVSISSHAQLNFTLIPPAGWKYHVISPEALKSGALGKTLLGTIESDSTKQERSDLLRIHVHTRGLSAGKDKQQITDFLEKLGPPSTGGSYKVIFQTNSFGTFRKSHYRVLESLDTESALTVVLLAFSVGQQIIGIKAVIEGSSQKAKPTIDKIRLMLLQLRIKSEKDAA